MFYLEIQPVRTTSALRGAANPGDLEDEGYTVEDGYVIVDTQEQADDLISRHSNLALDLGAAPDAEERTPRATITEEDVEYDDEESTDEPEEVFDADDFVDRTPMSDVIDDIETGDYDGHLDAIEAAEADNRDRVGVANAIEARRE